MMNATVDPVGVEYVSEAAMARTYGVDPNLYYARIRCGWSVKSALTREKADIYIYKECEDHLGNRYAMFMDMLAAWGLSYQAYHSRKVLGWELDRILETPVKKGHRAKVSYDHTGQRFASKSEMAKAWGILPATLRHRLQAGLSLKEALTNPIHTGSGRSE